MDAGSQRTPRVKPSVKALTTFPARQDQTASWPSVRSAGTVVRFLRVAETRSRAVEYMSACYHELVRQLNRKLFASTHIIYTFIKLQLGFSTVAVVQQ
jgi:hypothetical protein